MKITALVENQTHDNLKATHGLSLYIETKNHKLLFDLGPDDTLFKNAKTRGINLSEVDTVIISHGHFDHGGALRQFLQVNSTAKIYVQQSAFDTYYSKFLFIKAKVGLECKLKNHPQVILIKGEHQIDEELTLFTVTQTDKCYSSANDALYDKNGKDMFSHEQNLIITENQTALIMGCGHTGLINIMDIAQIYQPTLCIGGFHLFNPFTKKSVSTDLLDTIIGKLQVYSQMKFYTCHCTGTKAFQYLADKMPNLFYLSCGETIEVSFPQKNIH